MKQQRTVSLNKSDQGTAEFNLLISPSKVEQVKFIKGDDALKGLSQLLQSTPHRNEVSAGLVGACAAPRRRDLRNDAGGSTTKSVKTATKNATIFMTDKPQTVAGPCTLELRPADSVRTLD